MSARSSAALLRALGKIWKPCQTICGEGWGVPKPRSNLTEAQKLRVIELDGEWAVAKQEREAAHQKRG
ncbi:hypothetical protein Asppvi_010308 [Aspergillus pseudoviridinutans]|uniref:Uncharacterized protein n=1 Tax=Aspergillus pseudoviridinutans TaxID=1517512 RepID=A0A9P3EZT9_9EURO|nr:uncharacterized protein Asppvi_010308 [Aspergillus pseudoviridinutans]GIJ91343.1 hypothetical protein Asppvi_010308 [Aspergillus pseudoviridinutans]